MKIIKYAGILLLATLPAMALADSTTDQKIEDTAKASYAYKTVLEDLVTVKANDGVVTLTGNVANNDLKNLAEDTVSNLPGVIRVDNRINVDKSQSEQSDDWIAFKIRFQLLTRANVSASKTTVTVKDGAVTLDGTAISQAQKDLTEAYAKDIDGVTSVKNNLIIIAPASDLQSMKEAVDDASITAEVKSALRTYSSTRSLKPTVVTNDGTVTVTGEADSDAQKSLVTKLAKSVRGVKLVDNNLTVKM